jgi:hypothetical protein
MKIESLTEKIICLTLIMRWITNKPKSAKMFENDNEIFENQFKMFKNFVKMLNNKAKMSDIGAQMFECSTL